MRKILWLLILLAAFINTTQGQKSFALKILVMDEQKNPLPGAIIMLTPGGFTVSTKNDGTYEFSNIGKGKYVLEIRYLGFEKLIDSIDFLDNSIIKYQLKPASQTLEEVIVIDHYTEDRKRDISLNSDIVDIKYLKRNLGASLMNSLDKLPGVDAMNIGSGQSKPMIRGLGFNRVVVVENGISHQGQQWGADHGLEIDQYALDRVEVIRGPASLMYGSDAMGGIIDLRQMSIPQPNTVSGDIDLTAKSNNGLVGGSAKINTAFKKWFFGFRTTWLDWGDYRVPADFVDVYSYRVPLKDQRLRNTAGHENDLHFDAGINLKNFNSRLYISNYRTISGFFANAHGLEPRQVDTAIYDASWRDIQNPYQEVNHLKIINKSRFQLNKAYIETNLGFQQNHRFEYSDYVSHGFMPSVFPENLDFNPELEREFSKTIISLSAKSGFQILDIMEVIVGLSTEYQNNTIGGRGFLLPDFTQLTSGAFFYAKKQLSKKNLIQGGIRYDFSALSIEEYYDWFASPQIENTDTQYVYLQRAENLERKYSNFNWSVGYNFNGEKLNFKVNMGKSFRTPLAQELAANGVNYHYFRFEQGDPNLKPEVAYQFDAGAEIRFKNVAIGLTPFVSWFQNYIYLNPSFEHDRLYGNGNQIYSYTQAEVLRFGGELHSHIKLTKFWNAGFVADYVYSEQLTGDKKGFTLPFSPPASASINLKFNPKKVWLLNQPYSIIDLKLVAPQNYIVPPEEKTPGYYLVNLALGGSIKLLKTEVDISFQVHNLLNRKYLDHISFYRLINLPETGRNFILNLKIPFKTFLNKN